MKEALCSLGSVDECIAELELISGWFWEQEYPFPAKLQELEEFVEAYKRIPKPSDDRGVWVKKQHTNYSVNNIYVTQR